MLVSVPSYAQKILPGIIISGDPKKQQVYLTFDDGPIPEVTLPILDILKKEKVVATFFEVGENVFNHPNIHERILEEGHQVANHTYNHLDGWNTKTSDYIKNVEQANALIKSNCFRPPYGRLKPKQVKALKKAGYNLAYWSVLSKDYSKSVTKAQCLKNCVDHVKSGSVVLMHDSIKAQENVLYVLPRLIKHVKNLGLGFGTLRDI